MKNFLIYKSSAGSGKTYTLVKEYLKLVLSSPRDFRHTLAVTFTNKAAEEMKSRVIEKLAALAAGNDPRLEKELVNEGVKANIPLAASEVLSLILHEYSGFSISTIDSFFHKVIRSFARELKLQLGYDVELDTETVLNKIVDEVFDKIGSDDELRKYIEDYVYYNIDDKGDWRIEYRVKELAGEIFKERYWEKKEENARDLADNRELMPAFISEMFAIVNSFEGKMNSYNLRAVELFLKHGLELSDFPHGKSGFMNYLIGKIPDKEYEPGKRVLEAFSHTDKWISKKSKPNVKAAMDDGLVDAFNGAIENYNKNHRPYYTAKELTKTIYILGIFSDFLERLKEYRDENRLLLISDTNNFLKKIIAKENSPFIYEKIGNTYKNFLVDEFQDTSNYQWDNLKPLVENSLSEGNFSMIVGDVKQSIYRWRSGNMMLLLEKVQHDLHAFDEMIEVKPLSDNWRSRKEIIEFNNTFFTSASKVIAGRNEGYGQLIEDSYKEAIQNNKKSKEGGFVSVDFIPVDKQSEQSTSDKADVLALQYVKDAVASGFDLKDIMVLVRKRAEGSRIAAYLLSNGLNVVSNESMLINNSPKIKLLVNLLKYISDEKNILARTEILYNYLVYIKNESPVLETIFKDARDNKAGLFRSSLPPEFFEPDSKSTKISSALSGLNLYELTEDLINIFGLGTKADSYLLRFLDVVQEYLRKNSPDITSFLAWWEENKDKLSIIVPEEENAVRVLTIHKAKGLQSPVVIMPYANWEMDLRANSYLWVSSDEEPFDKSAAYLVRAVKTLKQSYFEKDYEDEYVLTNIDNLNVLYVAFTRAIERLHVICPAKKNFTYTSDKLIANVLESEINGGKVTKGEASKKTGTSAKPVWGAIRLDEISNNFSLPKAVFEPRNRNIETKDNIARGLLLHEALRGIITADDIDNSVRNLLKNGLIVRSEVEDITNELKEITSLPEVKDWFSGKWLVKTEAVILQKGKSNLRPDRVLIKDKRAVIIDYKTGIELPEHGAQLNNYAEALAGVGFRDIEKYIFYINQRKVKKV